MPKFSFINELITNPTCEIEANNLADAVATFICRIRTEPSDQVFHHEEVVSESTIRVEQDDEKVDPSRVQLVLEALGEDANSVNFSPET